MEQTVSAFSAAREVALKFAKNASVGEKQATKRKADGGATSSQHEPQPKRLRSSTRLSSRIEATPPAPSIDVVEDSEDEDFEPEMSMATFFCIKFVEGLPFALC